MLHYGRDGAQVQRCRLLPEGQDIQPFAGERQKPSMRWENWDEGLASLSISNMVYAGCQLAVGYYHYANRGNRGDSQLSRSQATVSHWIVDTSDQCIPGYEDQQIAKVTAFFPVYDGIGFWISRRRRETGIQHYSQQEEVAIAQASAVGALGCNEAFSQPQGEKHLIYRCIWAPGKAYGSDGELMPSVTNLALPRLGLEVREVTKSSHDTDQPIPFKLYGDARFMAEAVMQYLPFTTFLAEQLHPAWKYVNSLPNTMDPPDPTTY